MAYLITNADLFLRIILKLIQLLLNIAVNLTFPSFCIPPTWNSIYYFHSLWQRVKLLQITSNIYNLSRRIVAMGCTSSILPEQMPNRQETHAKKETARIQVIIPSELGEEVMPVERVVQSDGEGEMLNTKMKKQKSKIQFLQQSQNFMRESVEISNQVQQAILSLTYNPLLHDEAYYKLIGMNKKTLEQKQNRINNLLKRELQAEQELKRERQKKIEKTKSEFINYRLDLKEKRKKGGNKENRGGSNINYFSLSKESFAQKMCKVQLSLIDSEACIN